jgi:hypothetical protein
VVPVQVGDTAPPPALPVTSNPEHPGGQDRRAQALYQGLIDLAELTDPGGYHHPTLHLIGTDPTDRTPLPPPPKPHPANDLSNDPPPF